MRESSQINGLSLNDLFPLLKEILDSGGEFLLVPHGTSMLPLIKPGRDSVILVKPNGKLALDDIALYKRNDGKIVLHRVVKLNGDGYDMCGDNQSNPEKGVADIQIIAKVSKLILNGKTYSVSDKKIRRYVNRRRNLKLRRIILAIKRRIPCRKNNGGESNSEKRI